MINENPELRESMLGELASHGVIDDLSLAVATTDLGGYDEKKPKNTSERRN